MAKSTTGEIRPLTGIRGVAAVLVVFYHALHLSSPVAGFLLGKGYLSVDLFFILSGYVLSLNYADGFAGNSAPLRSYLKFLGLRLARIYPLYIVTIIVATLLAHAGIIPLYGIPDLKRALIWNVPLLQAWSFGAGNIDGAAWSISTEWMAYLFFPVLVLAVFGGTTRRAWAAGALAYAVVVMLCVLSWAAVPGAPNDGPLNWFDTSTPLPILRCVAGFVLGMAIYRLQATPAVRVVAARPAFGNFMAVLLIALLFVGQGDALFVAVAALLVCHLAISTSAAARLLESPPIYYLGVISYSIYLVHLIVLYAMRHLFELHGWSLTAANLLAILVSLLLSPVAYHLVEVPGRMAIRRLLAVRRAPAATAP